jgi:hypothetical protein
LCLKYHPDKGSKVKDFQKLQSAMAIIRISRGCTNQKEEEDDELNNIYFIEKLFSFYNQSQATYEGPFFDQVF